jgi:hypothetical protein
MEKRHVIEACEVILSVNRVERRKRDISRAEKAIKGSSDIINGASYIFREDSLSR